MTDPTNKTDRLTDAVLADVATLHVQPDDALMARVLADAARLQNAPRSVPRPSLFAQIKELVGGWPGVSGVALAGVAGLWIGTAPTSGMENLAATLLGTAETISLTGEGDWLFEEGAIDG